MACSNKSVTRRKEPSIEDRRADVVRRMTAPGARRIELRAEITEVDAILLPLVTEGVELGITTRRIGELTGLSSSQVLYWARRGRNN